jgi:hypothetical protein
MHPMAARIAAVAARVRVLRMVVPHMTLKVTKAEAESATVPLPDTVPPPTADALPFERTTKARFVNAQYVRSGSTV